MHHQYNPLPELYITITEHSSCSKFLMLYYLYLDGVHRCDLSTGVHLRRVLNCVLKPFPNQVHEKNFPTSPTWSTRPMTGYRARSTFLWVHKNLFWQLSRRRKLASFGHVTRHDSLSNTILHATLEGWRRHSRQRKCWKDNIKDCPCQNCSQGLHAEKTGTGSLLNCPSCLSPPPPPTPIGQGTELNWLTVFDHPEWPCMVEWMLQSNDSYSKHHHHGNIIHLQCDPTTPGAVLVGARSTAAAWSPVSPTHTGPRTPSAATCIMFRGFPVATKVVLVTAFFWISNPHRAPNIFSSNLHNALWVSCHNKGSFSHSFFLNLQPTQGPKHLQQQPA